MGVVRGMSAGLLLAGALLAAPAAQARGLDSERGCLIVGHVVEWLDDLRARTPDRWWWRHFRRALDRAYLRGTRVVADRCVRLNQVQALGTHNSYHIEPVQRLINLYIQFDPSAPELQYTHRPLPEQLGSLGVRQIELDVFHDPEGGLYSEPFGLAVREGDFEARIPELDAPGVKVLHIQELDWDTTCQTLVACLEAVRAWSEARPGHLPFAVLVEAKDDPISDPLGLGFAVPLPYDSAAFDELDRTIRSVFPPSQLITPDDVRRDAPTLEEAVLERGWPRLGEARGRVIFLLDNGGAARQTYLEGHPSLEGRVMFTNAVPGEPDAAFVKMNEPRGDAGALIRDLVATGYLVRTRADAGTQESRSGDTTRRDAALASGAQYVSSDYPEPDPRFTDYFVAIPGGEPARCNPVNAPAGCRSAALER